MPDTPAPRFLLTYLIKTLHQALRAELDEGLREIGLTLPQMAVLSTLKHIPGASSAALARAAFVSPQTMGELLATLERGQLVERTADPRNARVLRTTLTPRGVDAHARGSTVVARVESRLGSALSAEEQIQLRGFLERCAAALGAGKPEGGEPPSRRDGR